MPAKDGQNAVHAGEVGFVMTNERKWTAGPWTFDPDDDNEAKFVGDDDHEGTILNDHWHIARIWNYRDDEECRANAHLIAAAPELYEALERMEKHFRILPPKHDGEGSVFAQATAALAKARGEQP